MEIRIPEPDYKDFILPSNPNTILHVRPLTMKDERLFVDKTLAKKNKIFEKLVQQVVRENVNYNEMFIADQVALLLFLRIISYGVNYEFNFNCTECNTKNSIVINLESLPVKYNQNIDIDYWKVYLPNLQKNVIIDYPRVKHSLHVNDTYDLIVNLIREIEGYPKEAIPMVVQNLIASDWALIRNTVLNERPFGVDTSFEFSCINPGCILHEEPEKLDIPIASPEFFRI